MIFPPSLMRVRTVKNGRRKRNLWIPLILLWPTALVLGLALLPLVLVWAAAKSKVRLILAALPAALLAFCALRGVRIETAETDESMLLYFT